MPSLAVLATWAALTLWAIAVGAIAIPLTRQRMGTAASIRVAMWIGITTIILALVITNFFVPLRSSAAITVMAIITAVAIAAAITLQIRSGRSTNTKSTSRTSVIALWAIPLVVALIFALLAIAHYTFVAVNQWDTGLYHLNAIQYAADYRVIPGLANLHDRLGTTNSHHLLTAFVSNSGWGIDAFRLSVGFFAFLFSFEAVLRLLVRRAPHRSMPSDRGLLVMLLASLGIWAFLLSNPDEVITSASPDAVALLVMVAAGAYWIDAITTRRLEWAATALVVSSLAGAVRPQLWVFTVVGIVVFLIALRRQPLQRTTTSIRAFGWIAASISALLLITTQARDAVQTGWILFPLDRLPLPVDWRAFDPAASREWIVSWARQPGASPGDVNDNWNWLPDWIVRNSAEWSIQLLIGLIAVSAVVTIFLRSRKDPLPSALVVGAAIAPAIAALIVWFFTAPDPRFAWGPLILAGAIPAALLLGSATFRKMAPAAPMLVTAFATLVIFPISISALLAINGELEEGEQVVQFSLGPWTIAPALVPVTTPEL